jgi:ferredoxin
MPWVQTERCIGCGKCVSACPEGAIELVDGEPIIDLKACRRFMCGKCRNVCPVNALMSGFKTKHE